LAQSESDMHSEYEDFLPRAAKCREMAKLSDPENAAHLMRIAAAWERLAQEAAMEKPTKSAA
jgi:hypothetical protein